MSQNAKILAHMKRGLTITPLQALDLFGCMRLSARIDELEEMGYSVYRVWVTVKNREGKMVKVRRYSLITGDV